MFEMVRIASPWVFVVDFFLLTDRVRVEGVSVSVYQFDSIFEL